MAAPKKPRVKKPTLCTEAVTMTYPGVPGVGIIRCTLNAGHSGMHYDVVGRSWR